MGMACDAERGAAAVASASQAITARENNSGHSNNSQVVQDGGGVYRSTVMNTEETAMILTSLSKGRFGAATTLSSGDEDEFSGEEDEEEMDGELDDEHGGPGGASSAKVHRVQQINFNGPVGSKLDFLDEAGFNHRFRFESNRVKSLVTKHISIDELRAHFDRPIIDVAKDFGICITLMKKICRRNGIKRWPHRQIRSLSKSIASMEAAMLSAHGSEREKYRDQILNLKMKRESVIADPNKENGMRPKTPPAKAEGGYATASHRPQQHIALKTSKLSLLEGEFHHSDLPHQHQGLAPVSMKLEQPVTSHGGVGSTPTSAAKGGRWTSDEHAAFLEGIRLYGKDWRRVAQVVRTRSAVQTRTHAQKYLLKFAGRFPFDTEGVMLNNDHQTNSSSHQLHFEHDAREVPTNSMLKPSHAAVMPSASDSMWQMTETPLRPRVEAMAMILNSPQRMDEEDPRPMVIKSENTESVGSYNPYILAHEAPPAAAS